jgi:D-3-phosphoglycerate dehydrogenase
MSELPAITVAVNSFPDVDRVLAHYEGRAAVRFADISTPAAVAEATEGAAGLVVATQPLTEDILEAVSPTVRAIGRAGVGLDSIDLTTAERLGIAVVNQPAYGATEVASQAVAMMLALQRKLTVSDRFVRGGWQGGFDLRPMPPLDEINLGLLGCGRIGAETARLAAPFVNEVLVFDPYATTLPPGVRRASTLEELLGNVHLLSIHSPLTEATRGLLGFDQLSLLPAGSVVINVARGGIVDEDALAALLESGHLGGAGLDVFAHEPLPSSAALLKAPNTLLSPHVAAFSDRSSWRLASWTIDDVLGWLENGRIQYGAVAVAGRR